MKDKEENMKLWDSLKETNTKWTKPAQNNLTSVNGQYCMMRATEAFGPCGIGWGYTITEERYDEGPEINHETSSYRPITHTLKIKFWYKLNGEKGEIEHFGHTPFIMKSKRGPYQDDEAPKKSLTDAIKKCLSMIGVAADIHLGQFDDINYKNEMLLKEELEREKEAEEKEALIKKGLAETIASCKETIEASTTIPAINGIYKHDCSEIRRECKKLGINPQPMIDVLTETANNKKESLSCK